MIPKLRGANHAQRRFTKADMNVKMRAYDARCEQYAEMTLEELMEKFNENNLGGVYRQALIDTINRKQSNN
jgi:hypothetical protein